MPKITKEFRISSAYISDRFQSQLDRLEVRGIVTYTKRSGFFTDTYVLTGEREVMIQVTDALALFYKEN